VASPSGLILAVRVAEVEVTSTTPVERIWGAAAKALGVSAKRTLELINSANANFLAPPLIRFPLFTFVPVNFYFLRGSGPRHVARPGCRFCLAANSMLAY